MKKTLREFQGSEAPSVLSSTLLVFLAMYPELQEEIYQEQVNIFGDDLGREPDLEDLKKMELLNMTIKEVLRHTSTPLIHKQATADIQLGGTITTYFRISIIILKLA